MEENKNIQVTEQDIFNFVFYPDTLTEEKKNIIIKDSSFSEAVDFYMNLKREISSNLDLTTKRMVAKKISAYSLPSVIVLHQLKEPAKERPSRLAADSETELKPRITTKTFVDDEKNYMVKILQNGKSTKIFVFSTQDEILENFNLYIEPQELEFHFKDNTEPLVLEGKLEIENIKIHFE
jgi:hypothetical protein